MSYNIYSSPHEKTSPIIAKALEHATQYDVFYDNLYRQGGWMGFGSPYNWASLQKTIKAGENWIYGDHGVFGRHKFYRLTKNGYYHSGQGKTDHKRLRRFWRRPHSWVKGKYIIICPQSDGFFRRKLGMTQANWVRKIKNKIKNNSDRPIIIHNKFEPKPLIKLLPKAWIVVSYSSNSALEAIMHGVPAINIGESHCDLLTTKGIKNIENPYYPENRMDVAGVLADNQWSIPEIRMGIPFRDKIRLDD